MPVAAVVATVGSSLIGSSASRSAARAQQRSADAATAEQRRQYDLTREDYAPYRHIGVQALNALGSTYGYTPYGGPAPGSQPLSFQDWAAQQGGIGGFINGGGLSGMASAFSRAQQEYQNYLANFQPAQGTAGSPGQPNFNAFMASPDYNFRRTEGMRGIEQSAAASGGAFSGNALRALNEFNSNLASGEFGNWFNRQAALAGIGQAATNATSQFGANAATNIGNNVMAAGNARASGIVGQANALTGGLSNAINAWQYFRGGYGGGMDGYGGGWSMGNRPPWATPPFNPNGSMYG